MNTIIKSLNAQFRAGNLERNTLIALRGLAGEPQVELAKEFGLTKQRINAILNRYLKMKGEKCTRL